MSGSLPEILVERSENPRTKKTYIRRCPTCGYEYKTMELPISKTWDGGRADCCPQHRTKRGFAKINVSARRAQSGKYRSPGLSFIVALGGYYRRRHCTHHDCEVKWTTGEFLADGTVGDVMTCPRCGDHNTRIRRDTIKR